MIMKIYTVFDSAAQAYLQPFFFQADGQAKRAFGELVNDKTHSFGKHPDDYTLFLIGYYDDATGLIEPVTVQSLGNALEYLEA